MDQTHALFNNVTFNITLSFRFFKKHPEHKALHKSLGSIDDDDTLWNSTAFEMSATNVFNTIDEVMETMDGKLDMGIFCLENAGRAHAKIPDFQAAYFKVRFIVFAMTFYLIQLK